MERPAPAYRGDEAYVFVCYSHQDRTRVYPQIAWLQSQGVNVWYDQGISPGQEWSEELGRAIEGAERLLFFVSPRSAASRHCRNELNFAQNHEKQILSVYLEPTRLSSGVELVISASQAIVKHELPAAEYEDRLLRALGRSEEGELALQRRGSRRRTNRTFYWSAVLVCSVVVTGFAYWLLHERVAPQVALDRSVAILPFSVVGDDSSTTTYAQALVEELRTHIARYPELRSITPTDITLPGDVIGASYVFSGNVQPLGDRLRLRVSLVRTGDRETAWTETFERPMIDIAADPAEMAATVARFLRLRLVVDHQCETVRHASRSKEAASAYCTALEENYRFSQVGNADFALLMSSVQHALALDPRIPDAHNIAAGTFVALAFSGAMNWLDAAREAHAAVSRGLTLAPGDARLLGTRGSVSYFLDLDYDAAEASLQESLATDPIHPDAHYFHNLLGMIALSRGKAQNALGHARRSLRMNDSDANNYRLHALALALNGDYRQAVASANTGLELVQSGANRLYLCVIKAVSQSAFGDFRGANATLDDGLKTVGRDLRPHLAGPLAQLGRHEEARRLLAPIESLEVPTTFGLWAMVAAYAALDHDRAFDLIHLAIDRHSIPVIISLRYDSRYSELRKDVRWSEVMRHLDEAETRTRAAEGRR